MNKALFLDRDGVVNIEKNYVHRIEDFEFMEGIFDLCSRFRRQGYLVVVVTNQAGIARGFYTEAQYQALSRWMKEQFAQRGVELAGVYHCPHHPSITGDCHCRKPHPGMLLQAAADLDLDLAGSVLLGDKQSDLEAGRSAGLRRLGLVKGTVSLETVDFGPLGCFAATDLPDRITDPIPSPT